MTRESDTQFKVTNLATNVSQLLDVEDFEFDYASLVRMKVGGRDEILQFDKVEDDGIRYTFNLKGNSVKISVYNEA